jgi:hypothetical protein
LKTGETESEIITVLDGFCAQIANNETSACESLVAEYVPEILLLLEDIPASAICTALELC